MNSRTCHPSPRERHQMPFTSQRQACHTWTGAHAARTQRTTSFAFLGSLRQHAPAVAAASLNMCVRQPVHDRVTQRPALSQMSCCHLISHPFSSTLAITVTRPRTSLPHLPFPPATAIRLPSQKPVTEQNQLLAAASRMDGLFLTFAPSLRSERRPSADRPLAQLTRAEHFQQLARPLVISTANSRHQP